MKHLFIGMWIQCRHTDTLVQLLNHMYHVLFLCSLSMFPESGDENFVSCGEDSTIRVWKGT